MTTKNLVEQWSGVLDSTDFAPIENDRVKKATANILENALRESVRGAKEEKFDTKTLLGAMAIKEGVAQGLMESKDALVKLQETNTTGVYKGYDMPLVQMIRRSAPRLVSHNLMGTQVMTRPSDYVFFLTAHYGGDGKGLEALFQEADTAYSGEGKHEGTNPFESPYTTGNGLITEQGEVQPWAEMSLKIDRKTVSVATRNIRSNVTEELIRDLYAVHGLDARKELEIILGNETIAEINRECVRSIYTQAKLGCQQDGIAQKGTYDIDVDGDGTWSIEKFKGLMLHIDFEANIIMQETRRGKGNRLIVSPDVASALAMSGTLDYLSGLERSIAMSKETIGSDVSFVGTCNGFEVYVDPYATLDFVTIGYVGDSPFDAGLVYCPYALMEYFEGRNWDNLSEVGFGYKSRYGITNNPFVSGNAHSNAYYRKFKVGNLS